MYVEFQRSLLWGHFFSSPYGGSKNQTHNLRLMWQVFYSTSYLTEPILYVDPKGSLPMGKMRPLNKKLEKLLLGQLIYKMGWEWLKRYNTEPLKGPESTHTIYVIVSFSSYFQIYWPAQHFKGSNKFLDIPEALHILAASRWIGKDSDFSKKKTPS